MTACQIRVFLIDLSFWGVYLACYGFSQCTDVYIPYGKRKNAPIKAGLFKDEFVMRGAMATPRAGRFWPLLPHYAQFRAVGLTAATAGEAISIE
jgi:hypothetical protein